MISPLADDQVLGLLRWAGTRRMLPYHILIGDGSQLGGKAAHWNSVLKDRNLMGISVSSLNDLPSALGGVK
ncbi:hypothetical protein D3C73_1498230 [compost metagenome]